MRFSHRIVNPSAENLLLSPATNMLMRRSITIAIALAVMTLTFVLWRVEVRATDAVLQKTEYDITANPYLPVHWLRPAY
jgi:hypothetical protein